MKKVNVNITELELFKFVFNRGELEQHVVDHIMNNKPYNEVLEFYTQLKEFLDTDLSADVKRKLAAKIPFYNPARPEVIILRKALINSDATPKKVRLAAASASAEKVTASSYVNEGKTILARIVKVDSRQKLYIFSVNDESLKNFSVMLYPSGEGYFCQDNSSAIELSTSEDVEQIDITFQLNKSV